MNNIETYKICNGCHNCKYLLDSYDIVNYDSSYYCNLESKYPSKIYSEEFETEQEDLEWEEFAKNKTVRLFGKCDNWKYK